jgi:Asp-tRNA(Asn)/Glu-tRNA(Gln) amidotransferase C subunit
MSNNKKYCLEYWINSDQFSKGDLDIHVRESLSKILSNIEFEIYEKDKYLILRITSTDNNIDSCHDKLDFDRGWSCITKDELGDALRAQAYPLLADIEMKLRNFINQSMVKVLGFDWWDSFSPEKLREKVENTEKKTKKGQVNKRHQIEFTLFDDLIEIVTTKYQKWSNEQFISVTDFCDLLLTSASLEQIQQEIRTRTKTFSFWDDVFINYFDDTDTWINLEKDIKKAIPVRNKVMHHRLLRLHEIKSLRQCHDEVDRVLKLAKNELSDTEIEDVKPSLKVITDQFSQNFYSDLPNSGMIGLGRVASLRKGVVEGMLMRGRDKIAEAEKEADTLAKRMRERDRIAEKEADTLAKRMHERDRIAEKEADTLAKRMHERDRIDL